MIKTFNVYTLCGPISTCLNRFQVIISINIYDGIIRITITDIDI